MKNKVTVFICIFFVSVIIFNLGTHTLQAAGNYQDSEYFFWYSGDGSDVVTGAREKLDATSAYAKNNSTHCSHLISVSGTNDKSYRPFNGENNCTYNAYYLEVAIGQSRYLPNLVYERGYKYCYLVIQPNLHDRCAVKGLWSPDSI